MTKAVDHHQTSSTSIEVGKQNKSWGTLPLNPIQPVRQGIRANRPVLCLDGEIRQRQVLHQSQDQDSSSSSTTTTTNQPAYILDGLLDRRPETGVSLLMATPSFRQASTSDEKAFSFATTPSTPQVVIKAMPQPTSINKAHAATWPNNPFSEIAAMQILLEHAVDHNPHVVRLLDCMQDTSFVYMVLPYLSNGDLFARVAQTDGKGLGEDEARRYFKQIVEGLLFMKQAGGLAHHDVSLENIMFDEDDRLQLIDMGLSMRVPRTAAAAAGSGRRPEEDHRVFLAAHQYGGKPGFVAPEIARMDRYIDPFAADVWSLGVCLYMMLTGRVLYRSPEDPTFEMLEKGGVKEKMEEVLKGRAISASAKDLLCKMLKANPMKRPKLEEVQKHAWVVAMSEESGGGAAAGCAATATKGKSSSSCAMAEMVKKWAMAARRMAGQQAAQAPPTSRPTTAKEVSSPQHQQTAPQQQQQTAVPASSSAPSSSQ